MAVESLEAVAAKPDCSGLTIQRGNGSQYAGKRFRKAASNFGIRLRFIWKGTPRQNGHIESFHRSLKQEYIWPHDFANYQQAVIAAAFRDYNRNRLHPATKYVPPEEFHASWEAEHKCGTNACVKSCKNRSQNMGSKSTHMTNTALGATCPAGHRLYRAQLVPISGGNQDQAPHQSNGHAQLVVL